ncbi:hypothetical protein [Rubrivirga sp. IMCC43871]|uniref:hypothetical protein n=1 Tax=Rubrivirga sp. IMCC43871 TaxID=3391575 RepID=UPI00398FC0EC
MRSLAVVAAALVLVACDSADPSPVSVAASAEAVTLVGLDTQHGDLGFAFDYVGRTPSPCHVYSGYGTSTRTPHDGEVQRIEVTVSVIDESEGACVGAVGTVEREVFARIPGPGVYDVAFERVNDEPLELRVRATLGAAVVEGE